VGDRRIVEFDRLNWLGKAVYSGGLVAAAAGRMLDYAVSTATTLIDEAERAFRDGLDDSVDDAHIVEEEFRTTTKPRQDHDRIG
jgi:hypothetical protein